MIFLQLFIQFFKTGLFTIGGGLATLPFLYEISDKFGWFTHADIADMIAVSESTPGAIGVNMATYAGFKTAGIFGSIIASMGLILPSIIIILIIARILLRFKNSKYVERAFYGLRAASLAMVSAAGVNVLRTALIDIPAFRKSGLFVQLFNWKGVLLAVALFFAMKKLKWHPAVFLGISAAVGIVFHFGA